MGRGWSGNRGRWRNGGGYMCRRRRVPDGREQNGLRVFFSFSLASCTQQAFSSSRSHRLVWGSWLATRLGHARRPAWDTHRAQPETCPRDPPSPPPRQLPCKRPPRPVALAVPRSRAAEHTPAARPPRTAAASAARQRHAVAATHAPLAACGSVGVLVPARPAGRAARGCRRAATRGTHRTA